MLGMIADIAGIVGGLAVVSAVIFAALQIRQLQRQRRDSAAIELMRILQAPRFVEAFLTLGQVPNGISAKKLRSMGREYEEAAMSMVNTYETVGLLVFRNTVSFKTVREVSGGILASLWGKLHVWVSDVRHEQGSERFAEWFQWLVDRIGEQEAIAPTGSAYERFTGWQPRG
jgi:hypothetical protein